MVQWMVDGVALCEATDIQAELMVVSDGSGGAIATWSDYRSGESSDIYAQRVHADGSQPVTGAMCQECRSRWTRTTRTRSIP